MNLKRQLAPISLALAAVMTTASLGLAGVIMAPHLTTAPVAQAAPGPAAPAADTTAIQSTLMAAAETVSPAVVLVKTDSGLGSGVIYDAAGYVVTNAHVVDGARTISVDLSDGRRFPAKVLGADTGFDLAILQITGDKLPVAKLGTSSTLKPGQFVVAIGNPYGFDHTVTMGVVSALNRPINGSGSSTQPMIQTDAAINPGNSGGPLIDLDGNIVGINTLVAAPQGYPAAGLGFAIPVDTVSRIAPQLVKDGQVTRGGRPYVGLGLTDYDPAARQGQTPRATTPRSRTQPAQPAQPQPSNAGTDRGALVGQVQSAGPAGQAGLRNGDIIVGFDGKDVSSVDAFLQELVLRKPGDQVTLSFYRDGQPQTAKVTLGEAPASAAGSAQSRG